MKYQKDPAEYEELVRDITGGKLTWKHCPYDVISGNGQRLEVIGSQLKTRNPQSITPCCQWRRPLGDSRNKTYDRLILVGEPDAEFLDPRDRIN